MWQRTQIFELKSKENKNNNLIHILTLHIGYVEISNQKKHKNGFASHVGLQMTTYPTTRFHALGLCEDLHFNKEVKCGAQLLAQNLKNKIGSMPSVDKIVRWHDACQGVPPSFQQAYWHSRLTFNYILHCQCYFTAYRYAYALKMYNHDE